MSPFYWASAPEKEGSMERTLVEVYKKLICDMVQNMENERFLKQIYSIILRETKRTGS